MTFCKSEQKFFSQLEPGVFDSILAPAEQRLLIYDKKLESQALSLKSVFPYSMGVEAGEGLKDFHQFSGALEKILSSGPQWNRQSAIVTMGGGSVGDFAGFVASILKRGVKFYQIPSTWLAAIDSAQGGKTALNFQGIKNQLGTFYPAQTLFLCRDLLESQGKDLEQQAWAELLKIALIDSPEFWQQILSENQASLWNFLPRAIEAKWKIVEQDPFEEKEIRSILNFGHSFGHVLESHYQWSHGEAVAQGLYFSLEWGREKKLTPGSLYEEVIGLMEQKFGPPRKEKSLNVKTAERILQADKKINAEGSLSFLFLEAPGSVKVHKVPFKDVIAEAVRQGWCQP